MSKAAKTAVDIISGEWGAQQSFHYGEALVCYTAVFSVLRDDTKNGCVAD